MSRSYKRSPFFHVTGTKQKATADWKKQTHQRRRAIAKNYQHREIDSDVSKHAAGNIWSSPRDGKAAYWALRDIVNHCIGWQDHDKIKADRAFYRYFSK